MIQNQYGIRDKACISTQPCQPCVVLVLVLGSCGAANFPSFFFEVDLTHVNVGPVSQFLDEDEHLYFGACQRGTRIFFANPMGAARLSTRSYDMRGVWIK
jgi:hypothetical protein